MTTLLSSKQTVESYYISFDFDTALGSETISSVVVSAVDSSTLADATAAITDVLKQATSSRVVNVWVKAGTSGHNYLITCRVTGSSGTVFEVEALLPVVDSPVASITSGCGLMLPPDVEPVSFAEFVLHHRLDADVAELEADFISGIISAAREQVEDITSRSIITQTWGYCLDDWPDADKIKLPFGNLQSVSWVKWKDTDGVETTLIAGTDYIVETNGEWPGAIVLPYGKSWPTGTLYPSNPINIRFVCGWAMPSLVPSRIKSAIKILAADMYANREINIIGRSVTVTKTVENLLSSCRIWNFS